MTNGGAKLLAAFIGGIVFTSQAADSDLHGDVHRLIEILEDRESSLSNFRYELTESRSALDRGAQDYALLQDSRVSLSYVDGRFLIDKKTRFSDSGQSISYKSLWDGEKKRSLSMNEDGSVKHGRVGDTEPDAVYKSNFNRMLGLWRYDEKPIKVGEHIVSVPRMLPLSKWVREIARRPGMNLAIRKEGDITTLNVSFGPNSKTEIFSFDGARGGMLFKHEYIYELGSNKHHSVTTVDEAREVDGLWAPFKTTTLVKGTGSASEGMYVFEVEQLAFGVVEDQDLTLKFPVGTEVYDEMVRVAYRVTSDGGRQLLSVSSDSGEVLYGDTDGLPEGFDVQLEDDAAVGGESRPANNEGSNGVNSEAAQNAETGAKRSGLLYALLAIGVGVVGVSVWRYRRIGAKR